MGSSKQSRTGGIILIVLGLALLAAQLSDIRWWNFWPLLMIVGGGAFIGMYLRDKKAYGVLMPASVLIVIGCILSAGAWIGWETMRYLWPLFIAAPGIGFFAMYFFGPHEPGLLVPACILTGFAAIFLMVATGTGEYWPVILILIGALLMFGRRTPSGT